MSLIYSCRGSKQPTYMNMGAFHAEMATVTPCAECKALIPAWEKSKECCKELARR